MSKSKLISCSESILGLQSTYKAVECALWHGDKFTIQSIPKEQASSLLIPTIDLLMTHRDLPLEELACIVVNRGPAPFTTLRTVIATANGINIASQVPMIGINGLEAFLDEYTDSTTMPTVTLLNAFHNAVYFGIQEDGKKHKFGYEYIDNLLPLLQQRYPANVIRFLGNGTELYREKIIAFFQKQAYIPEPIPQYCSLEKVMQLGSQQLEQKIGLIDQIDPLYYKKPVN